MEKQTHYLQECDGVSRVVKVWSVSHPHWQIGAFFFHSLRGKCAVKKFVIHSSRDKLKRRIAVRCFYTSVQFRSLDV